MQKSEGEFGTTDVDAAQIADSDLFYFTGYMWDTPAQKEALLHALALCRDSGTRVIFDAADPFAVTRNRNEFLELIDTHVDILFDPRRTWQSTHTDRHRKSRR
ncbi:MAG: hypothetical protein R6U28_12250 [Cyclonatronaceae bacterium]